MLPPMSSLRGQSSPYGPWVCSPIDRYQAFLAHMSVDLGGLETGVAQQFLDHPQVSAAIEKVGGEAVAEGVGVGGHR